MKDEFIVLIFFSVLIAILILVFVVNKLRKRHIRFVVNPSPVIHAELVVDESLRSANIAITERLIGTNNIINASINQYTLDEQRRNQRERIERDQLNKALENSQRNVKQKFNSNTKQNSNKTTETTETASQKRKKIANAAEKRKHKK